MFDANWAELSRPRRRVIPVPRRGWKSREKNDKPAGVQPQNHKSAENKDRRQALTSQIRSRSGADGWKRPEAPAAHLPTDVGAARPRAGRLEAPRRACPAARRLLARRRDDERHALVASGRCGCSITTQSRIPYTMPRDRMNGSSRGHSARAREEWPP